MAHWISEPWPGIEPELPVVEAQNLNHWTTKQAPILWTFNLTGLKNLFHDG